MTNIIRADVVGKSQNRTALGMVAAFIKMHPNTTVTELNAKFPKQSICPDAGANLEKLFFTKSDIEAKKKDGDNWFIQDNACFTKADEWLTLGNGQQVAICKMWTAPSLALLQNSMKKFNIHGEVGSPQKGNSAGYAISYQFAEKKKGIPVWVWLLNLLIIIVVAYFYYSKFM